MKIICFTLMLGCLTTVSALAGDPEEKARDSLLHCGQFLIEEPGPVVDPYWRVGHSWNGPQRSRMCQYLPAER